MTTPFEHDSKNLAQAYDRVSDQQFDSGKRLVERLGLRDGARVLDVGCGTGRLTHYIAERVGTAIGIDPVAERIEVARSHAGAAQFAVGQAEDLSAFEGASFDAVCMSSVFHWIAEKPKALAEVRRVLRPGGRLGVTTTAQEMARAGTMRRVLEAALAREPYAGRVDRLTFAKPGLTTTDLVTLVLESGLELDELHLMQSSHTHANGEALVTFVEASAFGTFLRPVPEELRAPLRADLVAAFDAQRGTDGVTLRSWGVLFLATRA